jgi:type III restriction enzyme
VLKKYKALRPFLEKCEDIVSYVKNYLALQFKIDYQDSQGFIRHYVPDFIVKLPDKRVYIIETKGLEDLDVQPKLARLSQWCDDLNTAQDDVKYGWLYIKQSDFDKYKPQSFTKLTRAFTSQIKATANN